MRQETQALMDNLCYQMMELSKTLSNDPSPDSSFCARQVGQSLGILRMRIDEQWGKKLCPIQLVEPEPEVQEPEAPEEPAPAAPKAKKKNSPV